MPTKKVKFEEDEIAVFEDAVIYKRGEYWQFRLWLVKERKFARFSLKTRNQNTALENSQVIPALMRRFHEAKVANAPEVVIWGTGTPRREFLYVDDMAAASVFVMHLDKESYEQHTGKMQSHINVGFGSDVTIAELASEVAKATGYQGKISFDPTKPDGAPRKWMDSKKLNTLGWVPLVNLQAGLETAYQDFLHEHY